jgi:isoleucyl-tRNA synthetase
MATEEATLDLKKTVNLPKTNFGQKANLPQTEPARLKKWADMNLYKMIREARAGAQKFILHDGPPYANADIHLGTALNKILKDFIVKSRTMLGYDAPYVPGYDCHGLPIELHVERKLGEKKKDMPPLSIRRACREFAANALKRQTRDFQRLGILGEWEDPYITMSDHYEAETARLFARFVERGYVYKGARPVYWCIHDQTALAEAEVEYHQHTSPSVYVKFPLKSDPARIDPALAGKKVFALIWTTTPWTLPANLGIAVHPDFEYVALESGDEVYIVAADLANHVIMTCGIGKAETPTEENTEADVTGNTFRLTEKAIVKVVARFPGAKLDRLEAKHPWIDRPSLFMVGEHVTLGGEADAETELDVSEAREKSATSKAGTGLVHTAPGHGHDDFVIGKKYGLDIYCPVDNGGRFTSDVEQFASMTVFEANPKIVDFMRDRGVLLFSEQYDHRYPHCWRCKNPVIFRATPQWFISMDEGDGNSLRAMALNEVDHRVRWIPAWGRDRMRNMLKGRPDWCVSRQRVWGVPIPGFYCAKCQHVVADAEVIRHVADIFEKESADAWYKRDARELLPPNFKCEQCGATDFTKESDILDVWFDSGSSSIATLEARDHLRWPADVYIEGGDQFRGWFNSSLMVGLAVHDRAPYDTVLCHGWTLDAHGKAMHKSLGNAVSPDEVIPKLGAEILRLWCVSSDYMEDMRCSDEILQRVSDGYRKVRNTARFALGNLAGFDPARDTVDEHELQDIDRWALAELDSAVADVREAYEAYDFHGVYQRLHQFCTVTLSARYFDIIKDRLYTFAPRNQARRSAQTVLYRIADSLARMLATILAFTADEIWDNLPLDERERRAPSVHLALIPKAAGADTTELLASWAHLFGYRDVVLGKLEEARIAKVIGSSLEARIEISAGSEAYDQLKRHADDLRYLFIVSEVTLLAPNVSRDASAIEVTVTRANGEKCERCWNYSTRVGESSRFPTVCERCVEALTEIEATAGLSEAGAVPSA